MERVYWKNKQKSMTLIILLLVTILLPIPFIIIYKYNSVTLIVEAILFVICLIVFISKFFNGSFSRVGIGKEGFWVRKKFSKKLFKWTEVEYCKEEIVFSRFSANIVYQLFMKNPNSNTPRIIDIQKHKNAEGEIENYIQVLLIRNEDGDVKKIPLTINSWQKATIGVAKSILITDALLLIPAVANMLNVRNYKIIPDLIKWTIIILLVEAALIYLYSFKLKKRRIEVETSGITVHFYKKVFNVDWRDVTDIKPTIKTDRGKLKDYFKITVIDKKEYPFNALYIEKSKSAEKVLAEYFK